MWSRGSKITSRLRKGDCSSFGGWDLGDKFCLHQVIRLNWENCGCQSAHSASMTTTWCLRRCPRRESHARNLTRIKLHGEDSENERNHLDLSKFKKTSFVQLCMWASSMASGKQQESQNLGRWCGGSNVVKPVARPRLIPHIFCFSFAAHKRMNHKHCATSLLLNWPCTPYFFAKALKGGWHCRTPDRIQRHGMCTRPCIQLLPAC